ncbi:outer membrane protein, cobalt-zinc-cadmium efflux system [Sphingobacterium psychroaquaticum]|uniref:Outer membrane protein, cobalt-zinc-cadmium efflux system n=2 Tax=Sphingobacterium psychroaquaticum TaxID=561061 RepID=A0A1X7JSX5_9SPHI|nr:outer membrane protein, cobalt-zinc-cadmium efflux system [Sphingobacterium psychroaquaticum]
MLLFFISFLQAQEYTISDLEANFLANNYELIAQKFNIQRADAEMVQERVWPNPTFSISEVNIWKNNTAEVLPHLFGNYGKHQQIAFELEQMIETAGKRKKRVALRKLEKESEILDYEDLIRELKKDLRQTFNTLGQQERESQQLQGIYEGFQRLYQQYSNQATSNNVSKADVYRIQAELIALQKEVIALDAEKRESLQKLIVLTQIPDLTISKLVLPTVTVGLSLRVSTQTNLTDVGENTTLKKQSNELAKANQEFAIEKSNRVPDLTFQMNYDRGGNIMQDFIGLGVSFDIPVFNRNKSKIKAVSYQIEHETKKLQSIQFDVEQSALRLHQQLIQYEEALARWDEYKFEDYKTIVDSYRRNLQDGKVSLVTYVDFMRSFRESQQVYLELVSDYMNSYEELQYILGKDFQ